MNDQLLSVPFGFAERSMPGILSNLGVEMAALLASSPEANVCESVSAALYSDGSQAPRCADKSVYRSDAATDTEVPLLGVL